MKGFWMVILTAGLMVSCRNKAVNEYEHDPLFMAVTGRMAPVIVENADSIRMEDLDRETYSFLIDMDFDGKKEFLFRAIAAGQKTMDGYLVYDYDENDSLAFEHKAVREGWPYSVDGFFEIDDATVVNYARQELVTYVFDGYNYTLRKIYKRVGDSLKLKFTEEYSDGGRKLVKCKEIIGSDTIVRFP